MEIIFTEPGRPLPGSVITDDGRGWENLVAYYKAHGYQIVRVASAIGCVRCKGKGSRLVLPRGRRTAPHWQCRRDECPACKGHGYLGVVLVPHDHITGRDWVDPTRPSSGVTVTPIGVMTNPSSLRVPGRS